MTRRVEFRFSATERRASHPRLPNIRPLALLLLLLLPGGGAAVGASGDDAQYAGMTGVVTGDAADHRALQAALGVGSIRRQRKRCDGEQSGGRFHNGFSLQWLGLMRRARSVIHQSRAGDPVPSRLREKARKRSRRPFKAATA